MVRLISEVQSVNDNLHPIAFLNKADPRGTDNEEAEELLKADETMRFIDARIGQRKAFANAASQGMAVTELTPKDEKAIHEIEALLAKCMKAISKG